MNLNYQFAQATTGSAVTKYFVAPYPCKLESAVIVPEDSLAASGSNYITLTVLGNDLSSAVVTQTTQSSAFSADTPIECTISDVISAELAQGEIFKITSAATGTLANAADYTVMLYFVPARSV